MDKLKDAMIKSALRQISGMIQADRGKDPILDELWELAQQVDVSLVKVTKSYEGEYRILFRTKDGTRHEVKIL